MKGRSLGREVRGVIAQGYQRIKIVLSCLGLVYELNHKFKLNNLFIKWRIPAIMIDSRTQLFCPFKLESQTPTEASSEFNGESYSMGMGNKECAVGEEEPSLKKQQNKLKYRKLKQKLNNMGSTHDQKCVGVKEIGGPSKQKIMKLALDFQRQVKIQNRDYYYLELYSRELLKYVESRNEQELHLLRQSRMMPAIFELLQKVPMLHKNQFNQVLKTLLTCFKMIQIFTILSINRDYLILTNRLNNLISLINWIVGREERKSPSNRNSLFFDFQFLCFKVVNVLLNHRCKQENADNVNSIINTTLQLILCSQIFKKVKYAACEQLVEDGQLQQTQLVQEMLKFLLIVLRKSHIKKDSIDSLISKDNEFSVYNCLKINPELIKTIEFMLPSFISYFIQVYESQDLDEDEDPSNMNLPNITINILNLTVKILNVCFQVSYVLFKKIFRDIEREPLFSTFLNKLHRIIIYCKKEYEQQDSNNNAKLLLNEIIVFLGYIGLEDPSVQKKIYESLIFEEISNLPIQFMMDPNLREIITPTICCLIYENKTTLNFLMKDNSPLQIIKYLRKEIQTRPSLQRKNSTASLMSLAPNPIESGSFSYQLHRNQLSLRFPCVFWEDMCLELQKHA